jgi:hypothetical protein
MKKKMLLMSRYEYLRDATVNVILGGALGFLLAFMVWGPV